MEIGKGREVGRETRRGGEGRARGREIKKRLGRKRERVDEGGRGKGRERHRVMEERGMERIERERETEGGRYREGRKGEE